MNKEREREIVFFLKFIFYLFLNLSLKSNDIRSLKTRNNDDQKLNSFIAKFYLLINNWLIMK